MAGQICPDVKLPPPTENTPERTKWRMKGKNSVKSYKPNEKIKQRII